MALQAMLGCDTNAVQASQRVTLTLTISNPVGAAAVNITKIAPQCSPGNTSLSIGLPLIGDAPQLLSGGQTLVFIWGEEFFLSEQVLKVASANTPANAYPLTVSCNVYASDGTITTPATITIYVFPATGLSQGSTFTLPTQPGSLNFAINTDSAFLSALA